MIKRNLAAILLIVILASAFPPAAVADVLIEPKNSFFDRHVNEVVYMRRDFIANGNGGTVSVKSEPGASNEIAKIENGEIHQIQYTYNYDGVLWGVFDVESPGKPYADWQRGWVLMSDFLVVYDTIAFEEDHHDEIFTYNGSIDAIFDVQELIVWKYPCSGIIVDTVQDESLLADLKDFVTWKDEYPAYIDGDGREWVALPFLIKQWVCLSEPQNMDIAVSPNPALDPVLWQPGDEQLEPPPGLSLPLMIIILVALLAIGTVILIKVFWKKPKPTAGDAEETTQD